MSVKIEDTKLEVLTGRIKNGLEFCNSTWQRAKGQADNAEQYERLMMLLDSSAKRLDSLIHVARIYGLDRCVFGDCRWDEDSFVCFGCTRQ